MAVERELDRDEAGPGGVLRTANAVWDESGNFLMYSTMLGIKGEPYSDLVGASKLIRIVVNTVTNKVSRVVGKDESMRFLNIAVYQGAPAKKGVTTLVSVTAVQEVRSADRQAMAASANPLLEDKAARDPHLFATAYNKSRFYLFAQGEP